MKRKKAKPREEELPRERSRFGQKVHRVFGDVRRHPWLHVFSVGTVTSALVILGLFFLGYRNVTELVRSALGPGVGTVFLKTGTPESDREQVAQAMRALPGVTEVRYRSAESVRVELSALFGELPKDDASGIPELFEVQLAESITKKARGELRQTIGAFPGVEEADFADRWSAQYKKLQQFLGLFAFIFVGAIALGCSLLIANFMGLRHQSRRNEIDVMQLFGGERRFIFAPYFWEGICEGLAGSVLALGFLWFVQSSLSTYIRVRWTSVLGFDRWLYLSPGQIALLVGLGIATASIGSLSVFLRIRREAR